MKVLIANPAVKIAIDGKYERHFLNAGCRFSWSLKKEKQEFPRYAAFPFFLAYATAVLRRDGFDVKVIDGAALNLTREEFIQRAIATQPEIILFEPASAAINSFSQTAADLKKQTGARIVFAGSHVTTFPKETLQENQHVDFVLIGEYELTLLEVARRLRAGETCEGVRGVAYLAENGVYCGGQRAAEIEAVEHLPSPARDLFPSYFNSNLGLYHDGFCQHRPAVQLHSSRGCPFRCNYCVWIQVMYNNGKHRCFPAARVVDEMVEAKEKFGAKEIYFDDDDFTVRKEHVLGICDEIERRGLKIPWSVMGDAMATDEETLERMARAGCIGMKFGLESANADVLKRINKPVKLDRVRRVVNAARKVGIKTHMTVMFGLSGDTPETVNETFNFACDIEVDSVQFSVATPYPGTRFYNELKEAGRLRIDRWEDLDGANFAVYQPEGIDPHYLEHFIATAHGRWLRHKMRNPKWLFRQSSQLVRLARGQGMAGFSYRLLRGFRMLAEKHGERTVRNNIGQSRQRTVAPRF